MKTESKHRGVSIMLAAFIVAALLPCMICDQADANPGDSESDPLLWYNSAVILLPEVQPKAEPGEGEVLMPPESLLVEWGDGQSDVVDVTGYVDKGTVEILHVYAANGDYHIVCTPQKAGYIYESLEYWVSILGAPTVYFYDGDEEITHVVAENGVGVGAYEDEYFTSISAPADPTKTGKVFEGWYQNGEEFDFSTVIREPTILRAQWSDAPAPVTVNVQIDGHDQSLEPGTTVGDLTAPDAPEGYTFAGWFSDEECTVPLAASTVITDGMSIYSKFNANPAPEEPSEETDSSEDKGIVEIIISYLPYIVAGAGAVVIVVGLRYHPAIMVAGIVLALAGVIDIAGLVEIF